MAAPQGRAQVGQAGPTPGLRRANILKLSVASLCVLYSVFAIGGWDSDTESPHQGAEGRRVPLRTTPAPEAALRRDSAAGGLPAGGHGGGGLQVGEDHPSVGGGLQAAARIPSRQEGGQEVRLLQQENQRLKDIIDSMLFSNVREGFRFHMYDIPSRYIEGALEELEKGWGSSVCNRDVKKKTNYTMLDWRHAHSLFTVDIFMARFLRKHPLHTSNPDEADVFIIPAMTHLYNCAGRMQYLNDILSWIVQRPGGHWKNYHSHDHYIFWWRWGMNFGGTTKFFKNLKRLFPNINYISYEFLELMGRNKYQDFSLALKPFFNEAKHGIVMPYPDFSPMLQEPVPEGQKRDLFAFMSGTSNIGGIRRWIKVELDKYRDNKDTPCFYQDFGSNVIDTKRLGVPTAYPEYFKRSVFCMHAAGDGLSSRRPTSAVLSGCIPVLVCDLCLYAFENVLNYSSFAVFMKEDDVMQGRMVELLRQIPEEEIRKKQAVLRSIRHHFVYNTQGAPRKGDALDMLVTQLAQRGAILRSYRRWFLTHKNLSSNSKDYPADPPEVNRYKFDLKLDPTANLHRR